MFNIFYKLKEYVEYFFLRFTKPDEQFFRIEISFDNEELAKAFLKRADFIWTEILNTQYPNRNKREKRFEHLTKYPSALYDGQKIVIIGEIGFVDYTESGQFLSEFLYDLYNESHTFAPSLEYCESGHLMDSITCTYAAEWPTCKLEFGYVIPQKVLHG